MYHRLASVGQAFGFLGCWQVLGLAYAWVLTLGTLVASDADLARQVTKGRLPTYSLFRLGLRLWEHCMGQVSRRLRNLTHDYLCFLPPFPLSLNTVGD
jgi:hypothetical protein